MLTEQRHEIILNLLSEKGSITVTELKDILNTSESTIRRDLNTLDEQGRLTKVFGGAVEKINGVSTTELSVSQKADVNTEEKKKIAMYAARLVVPNDFIYIDAGTTTEYLIDYLEEKNATYVTNAVTHARKLAIAGFKVILIGGELKGLTEAVAEIAQLKEDFYKDVYVPGSADELNPELEKVLRVADFIELGQLMAMDALQRKESCGGHFREEYQDAEGETLRDDENFKFVGAWEYKGDDISKEELHKEELKYEEIKIAARNYK